VSLVNGRLTDRERDWLRNTVEACFRSAQAEHTERIQRFEEYYRKFRGLRRPPAFGEEEEPAFEVPAIQWMTYATWSRLVMAIAGPNAKIIVKPRGPADQKLVRKLECYMKWLVFEHMKAHIPLWRMFFQTALYGRSHGYLMWTTKTIDTPEGEQEIYAGPELVPLSPDQIILPAGDYASVQEAPWVIRRYWLMPQDLIDGEEQGRFEGITENLDLIINASKGIIDRSETPMLAAKDEAESAFPTSTSYTEQPLEVIEWYGKVREGEAEGKPGKHQIDVVVRYLRKVNLIIGVYDVKELFGKMSRRRPIVSFSMARDDSYWAPGIGELTFGICQEMTESDRTIARALQFASGPALFFRPTGGFDPESFRYRPGVAYPVDDPSSIKEISFRADIESALLRQQMLGTYLERVTGVTDQTLGRQLERPNAPRTLGGQQILLQQGTIRFALDEAFVREGIEEFLRHVWELDTEFSDKSVFFRVTEEDAGGLFPVRAGFSELTPAERTGFFDFSFTLGDEPSELNQKQMEALQLYQIDLGNPLIVQNPVALWEVTNRLHEAFGDDSFKEAVPRPPGMGNPKTPREEWTLALQGEDFMVHPMDNDEQHLAVHFADVEAERQARMPDENAIRRMLRHIAEHQSQLAQKRMMVGLARNLARDMEASTQDPSLGGIVARPPVPVSLQGLMGAVSDLAGGAQPAPPGGGAEGEKSNAVGRK
jgi:hypothetical protein